MTQWIKKKAENEEEVFTKEEVDKINEILSEIDAKFDDEGFGGDIRYSTRTPKYVYVSYGHGEGFYLNMGGGWKDLEDAKSYQSELNIGIDVLEKLEKIK